MFHKYKKGIISFFLSFAVMLSCCVPVFAKITTTETNTYVQTRYENEPVTPYNLWIGKGGDFMYRSSPSYYSYSFELATITKVVRNSDGSIQSVTIKITDANFFRIIDNTSSFTLTEYKDLHDDSIIIKSSSYSSTYFYKLNIDKIMVSTSLNVVNGETFTYLDHAGNEKTITFDGAGGIVGGFEIEGPDDNPFGDLTEQDYPEFNLPDYTGKDISEYVDFDEIIESIKGLDVAGAVQGLLGALKGGFKFTVDSVVNVVGYLTNTLKALFDWLKNTLPVLFNNFLVKLSPYFENLYNAIKDSPVGETLTDLTELYSKLDDLKASLISVLPEPIQNVINSIPDKIAEIKEKIETVANNILSIKDTIIDRVQTIIDNIKDIPNKIDDFKEYFLSLFDTTNIDLSARVDNVKKYAFSKFPILSTISGLYSDIDSMLSSFSREPPVIVFPTSEVFGGEDVTVSLGFLRPVIAITDVIIVAACYLLTLIYSIRAIPNIIGGIGSGTSDLVNSFSSSTPTFEQLTFFDDK